MAGSATTPADPRLLPPQVGQTAGTHGLAEPAGLVRLEEQSAETRGASRTPRPPARPFNLGDRIFTSLTTGFAALILCSLVVMIAVLAYQGWPAISKFGLSFITGSTWDTSREVYGIEPAILGTLYSSFLALLLAAPIGILIAIFLVEMAPLRVRLVLGFAVELLSAVPSIVYGLWALLVLVPLVRDHIEQPLSLRLGNTFLFSGPPYGLGLLPAALILSIMVMPTIAAISRDVMQAVPGSQREAMLALGATRWETAWKVIIPYARAGIIGAVLLALGRAVGETMAVQMVIGNNIQKFSASLLSLATTMPAMLVSQFSEATTTLNRAALIEVALILMIIAVLLNAAARLLIWGTTRKYTA